jgi:hypothetical protein
MNANTTANMTASEREAALIDWQIENREGPFAARQTAFERQVLEFFGLYEMAAQQDSAGGMRPAPLPSECESLTDRDWMGALLVGVVMAIVLLLVAVDSGQRSWDDRLAPQAKQSAAAPTGPLQSAVYEKRQVEVPAHELPAHELPRTYIVRVYFANDYANNSDKTRRFARWIKAKAAA